MTRDDITRLAREAGLPTAWVSETGVLKWSDLERFAKLAYEAGAAAESDRWTLKIWNEISHVQLNNQRLEPQFGQRHRPLAVRVDALLAVIDGMRSKE